MQEPAESPQGVLQGAIDIHLHSGPSIFPRAQNDIEVARGAAEWGVARFVLKAHEGSTAERARLVNYVVPGSRAVGSIVLNQFVGGLNPLAAELALMQGARVVWLPTIHAANHIRHHGGASFSVPVMGSSLPSRPVEGISLLEGNGELRKIVYEILDLVRDFDAVLATGHISPEETLKVVPIAAKRGIKRIVVNHPDFAATRMDLETQLSLAKAGAFIEFAVLYHRPEWAGISYQAVIDRVRRLGVDRFLLSSDFGQRSYGPPWAAFAKEVQGLLEVGLDGHELDTILRHNPAQLLD